MTWSFHALFVYIYIYSTTCNYTYSNKGFDDFAKLDVFEYNLKNNQNLDTSFKKINLKPKILTFL